MPDAGRPDGVHPDAVRPDGDHRNRLRDGDRRRLLLQDARCSRHGGPDGACPGTEQTGCYPDAVRPNHARSRRGHGGAACPGRLQTGCCPAVLPDAERPDGARCCVRCRWKRQAFQPPEPWGPDVHRAWRPATERQRCLLPELMLPERPVPGLREQLFRRGLVQREPEQPVRMQQVQAQRVPVRVRPVPEQRVLLTGGGRVFRPSRPAWIRALMRTPGKRREAS